ncbi:unnamed protein product [Mycena citricolor]|uniref:Nitrite reductase [NAD(P)H] n=1 Tax=Mycena citricolor TaxID=2018698 RepID=A0AAD2HAY6_9AGAR|nr:unnamed protein product [Mycena citricolor]
MSGDSAVEDLNPGGRQVIFVVGLGMVGVAFIEKLLDLDSAAKRYLVVTCGEEPVYAYNRVGLTEYFAHRNVEDLYIRPPSWYADQQPDSFRYFLGETVTSISPEEHVVTTSKGRAFRYDKCVLATGSSAGLPPYVSHDEMRRTKGVFVYRNISDLDAIVAYAEQGNVERALVVGGGLLGLEAAKAVYDLPSIPHVTIVHRQAHLLSRQLGPEAGLMVLRRVQEMGVEVLANCTPIGQLSEDAAFTGLQLHGGATIKAGLVVYAIGIQPRDDLAAESGIRRDSKGGIVVGNDLQTTAKDVFAIGECASWQGHTYGLIGPGIEMADILAFNLTQTDQHAPREMNAPDLSTKLKLMGIDVASFGDYFVDTKPIEEQQRAVARVLPAKRGRAAVSIAIEPDDGPASPIQCLVYNDPFSSTYKKYIFTADGKYLLGGQMIGDVSDFAKVVAMVKKKKALETPPSQLIIGNKGESSSDDLDDDAQVCSCHNVDKGRLVRTVRDGCTSLADIKQKTRAGTGCGGCVPLVTSILNAELKKLGVAVNNNLCPHFALSRADLFAVVRVKQLRTFEEVVAACGVSKQSLGCEICKPTIGSILSSLHNEHVMEPAHHQNQDTNDRFLGNIQRNGTFSVVPRIAAGEITPDGLIAIGSVAKKYGLYTKITGGQRIDLFGARKDDLPDIWEELNKAGFESGHAYGKALRTVKSCVGTTWCRFGVGDSVAMAVRLENRYKGIRSPHKFKGGVSGCVRECAEAQSKDFGVIATDKGWNIFVGGNGGATPRHADLFAKDVPPSQVVRILDRYLAYYIMTADRLQRTARWIEAIGLEKLRSVVLRDELGICADLESFMDGMVGTYADEWAQAVQDPAKRQKFRQFVNTEERLPSSGMVLERGQKRPADWAASYPPFLLTTNDIAAPKPEWQWKSLLSKADLRPTKAGTTSVVVKYGETQLAVFHVAGRGYFATQQMCPHKRTFVLDQGIVGESPAGEPYISCPMHKRNYTLGAGDCLNDPELRILTFEARENPDCEDEIQLLLPQEEALDAVLGTEKWMVRQATAEAQELNTATEIEVVGVTCQRPEHEW